MIHDWKMNEIKLQTDIFCTTPQEIAHQECIYFKEIGTSASTIMRATRGKKKKKTWREQFDNGNDATI